MLRRLNKQPTTSITGLLYGLARSPSTTKSQALRFSCQFVVVGTLSVVRNILVVMAVLTGVAVSSSVLTIAVLSADRLLAVRRPLSLAVYRASRHTWLIVAGVWLASLAIAAPLLDVRRLNTVSLGFGTHNTFSFCHEASRYFAPPHLGGPWEGCEVLRSSRLCGRRVLPFRAYISKTTLPNDCGPLLRRSTSPNPTNPTNSRPTNPKLNLTLLA